MVDEPERVPGIVPKRLMEIRPLLAVQQGRRGPSRLDSMVIVLTSSPTDDADQIDLTAPRSVAGPYKAPRIRAAEVLRCLMAGDRKVEGFTQAPIPWPYWTGDGGWCQLFVVGGLSTALETEKATVIERRRRP